MLLWLAALAGSASRAGSLLAAAAVPAALVGGWAFTRPALVEDGAERADRVADGAVFGVLALVGAALVAALVVLGSRRSLGEERRSGRRGRCSRPQRSRVAAASPALAVAVGNPQWLVGRRLVVRRGRERPEPARLARPEQPLVLVERGGGRVRGARARRARGRARSRSPGSATATDARNVAQPHSVPLQQLADGGVVALGLFVALVLAGARRPASARCAGSRARSGRPAVALVAAPAAYLAARARRLHAGTSSP